MIRVLVNIRLRSFNIVGEEAMLVVIVLVLALMMIIVKSFW